jgi:hypothetical protein
MGTVEEEKMNRKDRKTLDDLLRDLLSAQDDVTHWNEKGAARMVQTLAAIRHRDEVKTTLVKFVEALTGEEEDPLDIEELLW